MLPNIYEKQTVDELIARLNLLTSYKNPQWGKMNVAQMLAHCNVTYEMAFEKIHKKPNGLKRWILIKLVKPIVTNEKPYKKNSGTAPEFKVSSSQKFDIEKQRLIEYLEKTATLGTIYFDGKESLSFGKLSTQEWNNMFYKHLDHHLSQFGV